MMSSEANAIWRIVPFSEAEVERLPGKTHFWQCKPGMVADTNLMFVRAQLPPGEAHRWWNAGQSELHATGWAKPALNIEYFLTALFESTKRNGGKRPALFDAVFLTRRYRSEFGLLAIPAPVQAFVFPVVLALGYLLGKYSRYNDAPPPVA